MTLREILSHSAGVTVHGFPGYAAGDPIPTLVQVLDGVKPANTPSIRVDIVPGSIWRYSGGGYTIMQLAMTDVTHEPFPEIMRNTVLIKAGMRDSTYENPLPSRLSGVAATGYRSDGTPVPGRYHTYPEMAAAGLCGTTASDPGSLWNRDPEITRRKIQSNSQAGKCARDADRAEEAVGPGFSACSQLVFTWRSR